MGLREAVQAAAAAAIGTPTKTGAVGNIAVGGTFTVFGSASYDASAGAASTTTSTIPDVPIVEAKFTQIEIQNLDVQPGDKKLLIAANAIPNVTPKLTDTVTIGGVIWNVIEAETDPARAHWAIQARRS